MKKRVKGVISSLENDIDDVCMIGIKGMGGVGKTTLARAVYEQINFQFEGSSFVENVREISKNPLCGLKSLQKQILSDVLDKQDITVNGVYEGKQMIKQRLCGRKVLVVLDDVDHIDQLEALAGEPNWFKSGSRVIITTRDKQVLISHKVNSILDVNLLSNEEAICLFSRYAFGRQIPIQGYEGLSEQVICYASGLPLTIRVLGSFLCGKDELEWTDALDRLKTIPLKETMEILELSYSCLEEDYKEIFLDVACILKGWEKEKAIRALESCGFHARNGLRVLEQKSLITVSKIGRLHIHDHIEEMGKNIVRRLHPDEPYRHSRIWIKEEIEDIFVEDKGMKATRSIKVNLLDPIATMKGLQNMKELRFLHVICKTKQSSRFHNDGYDSYTRYSNHDYFDGFDLGYDDIGENWQYLPNSLRYLCWNGYPFTCLPKYFKADNLVGLEIVFSNIDQLWEGDERKILKKLRFIDLCCCKLRTLEIGLFHNLERLNLVACENLVELHMPVNDFKLRYLNLFGSKLRILDLAHAQNLEWLNLSCEHLVKLHMPFKCFKLKYINIGHSKLETLDLARAQNLDTLTVTKCENLVELQMPTESLKLKHLNLQWSKLKTPNLTRYQNLEMLDLECNHSVELHMSVQNPKLKRLSIRWSSLKTLNLTWCENLERLDLVCRDLVELAVENFKLETLNLCGSKLMTLDIGQAKYLNILNINDNDDLVDLQLPSERLEHLSLRCSNIKTLNLTQSWNLMKLHLVCEALVELQMPIESLKLKHVHLQLSKLKTLNLTRCQNLEILDLAYNDLGELHTPAENFKLKSLRLCRSKLRTLDIGHARYLERLSIQDNDDLVELHLPVEKLKHLFLRCSNMKTLNLTRNWSLETLELICEDLVEFHMPVENVKLISLNLRCLKLRNLDIERASYLKKLVIEDNDDLVELNMPSESPKLTTIIIRRSKLRTLHLGLSPYLERLDLHHCFNLVEIHAPIGCLGGCVTFKPYLVNQEFPMIGSLPELHLIARPLGICPVHPENNLPKFHFELIYKELQLSLTLNLAKLISFDLCACTNLAGLSGIISNLQCIRKLTLEGGIPEVPKEIDQLECLEELFLVSTKIEHLPDSICKLRHLRLLQLKACWFLKRLPEDLGRLECLEELHLKDCTSLRVIPNSICEMKRLKCFHLTNCILVEKLPKEIGRLKFLRELNIEGTRIRDFPPNIFQLEDLLFLL